MKDFWLLLTILGPLFIVGTVGISMFSNSTIGFLLLITHVLACITVGILFRFWKYNETSAKSSNTEFVDDEISFSKLGEIFSTSISKATSTVLMIGGFVVLFSVIISILKSSHLLTMLSYSILPLFGFLNIPFTFIVPFVTGLLEITNGIALISNIQIKSISINIIFTSFLLGIGGLSIFLQVFSIVSKTDLSIKPYVIGKILHGLFSAFYTFLFLNFCPIFYFNL